METINGATYYPPTESIIGRNKSMKITIGELVEKINDINHVIEWLNSMPDIGACEKALVYLNEYVDMLKDIKVDI